MANISADPLFLNAASATPFNHQLSLHTCSPANNCGDDFGILDDYTDINDAAPDPNDPNWVTWAHEKYLRRIPPVPAQNVVDMGAYETCLGNLGGDFKVEIDDLSMLRRGGPIDSS